MTRTELNAFRRTLESKQAELGDGNRNREALAIQTSPDELDRIQHASARDYEISTLERNSNRLHEVQAALGRLDAGRFGICADCEENITPKRLAALPWASFCIVCQETAERARKEPSREIDTSLVMAA